jgi:hypothetical protein
MAKTNKKIMCKQGSYKYIFCLNRQIATNCCQINRWFMYHLRLPYPRDLFSGKLDMICNHFRLFIYQLFKACKHGYFFVVQPWNVSNWWCWATIFAVEIYRWADFFRLNIPYISSTNIPGGTREASWRFRPLEVFRSRSDLQAWECKTWTPRLQGQGSGTPAGRKKERLILVYLFICTLGVYRCKLKKIVSFVSDMFS